MPYQSIWNHRAGEIEGVLHDIKNEYPQAWQAAHNPQRGDKTQREEYCQRVCLRLRAIGIPWDHLLNANHALALIVMAAVWKQISYNFLFFLAGLQSIPQSLIEAATIDGASPWRRFWTIVFPLLSPTTFFLLVINVVYAFFDTFAIIDATTGAA